MERRELFRIIAASAVAGSQGSAQHRHETGAVVDYAAYQPRFFTAAEYETLDRLCEIIIPADGHSPGAHQAQARFYIDTVLHYGDPQTQQRWRAGLKAVEDVAQAGFGKRFAECGGQQQDAIVARMAQHEGAPENELERFFGPLKRMTVEGYALSEVGARQGFGYKGDTSLTEFPGCTHPEHV
jgi:gluconate 2-dehydrogenase gamma chain